MYFAILGRHPKLSLAEFALVPTTSLRRQGAFLFFASDLEESALLIQLGKLGGIVKWGVVEKGEVIEKVEEVAPLCSGIKNEEEGKIGAIEAFLAGVSLVGVNDQKLGMELKKIYGIKRFKLVELTSSDLEIKKEGKELIDLGSGNIGLVFGRQDIAHFEQIDFEKPAHGMEVGMMPAKLAQMMVNIGIVQKVQNIQKFSDTLSSFGGIAEESIESGGISMNTQNIQNGADGTNTQAGGDRGIGEKSMSATTGKKYTIYDPFCGFGTTGFVAHRLGHHFIGSDIHIDGAKKNAKRRENEKGKMKNEKLYFTLFSHDVTEPFTHPVLQHVDAVVTEGWLGPVVSRKTRESELLVHAKKIIQVYHSFLTHIVRVCPHAPLVITLPEYTRLPDAVFPAIVAHAVALGYQIDDIGIYSRKGQEVCRRVVVMRSYPNLQTNSL